MSSRIYNLRNRDEAGIANQPQEPVSVSHEVLTRDMPLHLRNAQATDALLPLYSDVAVSRPPSPRKEIPKWLLTQAAKEVNVVEPQMASYHSNENGISTVRMSDLNMGNSPFSKESNLPKDLEDAQWTNVKCRRVCSPEALWKGQERSVDCRKNTSGPHQQAEPSDLSSCSQTYRATKKNDRA